VARVRVDSQPWYDLARAGANFREAGGAPVTFYDSQSGGPSQLSHTIGYPGFDWIEEGAYLVDAGGETLQLSTGGSSVSTGMVANTVDTDELYKVILLANGTVRGIPFSALPPDTPTGVAAVAKLASARISWDAMARATSYRVYRDGLLRATVTGHSYRDVSVVQGVDYDYRIQAVDQYGQRSALSAEVTAFIDPGLNVAPNVEVLSWPLSYPTDAKTLIRVNAADPNGHALTLALAKTSGSGTITATDDPSVWVYTP
jgi:hypothetical protein